MHTRFFGRPKIKRPLDRPRSGLLSAIRRDPQEIGWRDGVVCVGGAIL